jgi:hypothetical protein
MELKATRLIIVNHKYVFSPLHRWYHKALVILAGTFILRYPSTVGSDNKYISRCVSQIITNYVE